MQQSLDAVLALRVDRLRGGADRDGADDGARGVAHADGGAAFVVAGLGALTALGITVLVPRSTAARVGLRAELAVFRQPSVWLFLAVVMTGFSALFAVHSFVAPLLEERAGLTGGGLAANLERVLPVELSVTLDRTTWSLPPIFRLVSETGEVAREDLEQTLNCGVGMVSLTAAEDADRAMAWLTKAVAAGWANRAHAERDADLNFLRGRDDFKKLLAALPYPAPPPREVKR